MFQLASHVAGARDLALVMPTLSLEEPTEPATAPSSPIPSIVEHLTELVNPRIQPLFGAVPDRALEQVRVADTARTASLIGWKPKVALDEGLRRTVEWYAERVRRG